ncbi:MAG: hypothetical protein KC593_07770 [Myxococcales bacterium]|nr:hypothetical protein [Myxococcales bacterium]
MRRPHPPVLFRSALAALLAVMGCAESHTLAGHDADVVAPDVSVLFDGAALPDGAIVLPDGAVVLPDSGVLLDIGVAADMGIRPIDTGVVPDLGGPVDLGVDLGPPPPECSGDDECDDMDACTNDTCVSERCVNNNPQATCDRFNGVQCAGQLATSLLTINRSFCIPGFAINNPAIGNVSLCQGRRCSPSDTTDGCLITLESTGDPSTAPSADLLHVSGRITRIAGSVAFTGSIPNPAGGGTLPLNCSVSFGVGSGLPLSADLALAEQMMCGTDRDVMASSDVDTSMLTIRLSGTGLNAIICGVVNAAVSGQVNTLFAGLGPQLEGGINAALNRLDCGTCNANCPAGLTCVTP